MANFVKIAHRGSSGSYPENTRRAFEKAIEARVDMIEMDCQLSKDGHVMVFHDERLDRVTRTKGWLRAKTLPQLQKLDAGAWLKKSFKGERILTLADAIEIVTGKVDTILEIKAIPKAPLGIELKVLFILSHYRYLRRTIITSVDHRILRRVRELAPGAEIGVIHAPASKESPFEIAKELKAHSLHVEKSLASPALLQRARQAGLLTFAWTVNDLSEMQKLLAAGVDGIMSDYPEKFWKISLKAR